MPPPPPPNAPPPPAATAPPRGGGLSAQIGSGAGALKPVQQQTEGEKKPVEKRSALLSAIHKGTQLKKVDTQAIEQSKKKEVTIGGGGGFNVAKILERRAAMEFSEEDDDDSFDDGDWDP